MRWNHRIGNRGENVESQFASADAVEPDSAIGRSGSKKHRKRSSPGFDLLVGSGAYEIEEAYRDTFVPVA